MTTSDAFVLRALPSPSGRRWRGAPDEGPRRRDQAGELGLTVVSSAMDLPAPHPSPSAAPSPGGRRDRDRGASRRVSAADRREAGHHGHPQRDAGFVFRRRALSNARFWRSRQARRLVAGGADIIDVGAESTRPGHTPISARRGMAPPGAVARASPGRGRPALLDRHHQGRNRAPRGRARGLGHQRRLGTAKGSRRWRMRSPRAAPPS